MKKFTNKILPFLLLIFFNICYSQLETSHWYFGNNTGIIFSSGNAIEIFDGKLQARENYYSISDANGSLSFYNDGDDSNFNKNYTILLNSEGLLGNNSGSQSAINILFLQVDANDEYPIGIF